MQLSKLKGRVEEVGDRGLGLQPSHGGGGEEAKIFDCER